MKELLQLIPKERVLTRLIDRISFASDAGFYQLIPEAVVRPINETEIISLFKYSQQNKKPLVFRAGGTSLSGQSVTNGILVDISQHWDKVAVAENGQNVTVQPGITGAMVNARLRKHGRKIGPDPSSIVAAMMGGILSNNASGMCCGTAFNSYHTTSNIRFVLPNGQVYSTSLKEDYKRFEVECSSLHKGIREIRESILKNEALHNKIRKKYLTKTTIGYSLNAFIDFEHPLDIFAHLLIGAEGTLGFISEAILDTIPDPAYKSTALLYFPNMKEACKAIVPLTEYGAMMVELMDRASLRAVESIDGIDPILKELPPEAAALLIEFQETDTSQLHKKVDAFLQDCSRFSLLRFPTFTENEKERDFLWKIRKGLFPSVGAIRKRGTTVILEDLAFPVQHLGDAIGDLELLFKKFHYENAIIFGHAKDGNIHFVVTQAFDTKEEIARYDAFIKEVVVLVVDKYEGSLKAEHGTGRNMAPFVETEWGGEAYEIMKTIKELADPSGLLNPGVIINDNPHAHITDLKELPGVEEEVDKCIECGYCEPVCPSHNLTASPRRRIVVRRALETMKKRGDRNGAKELTKEFQYEGIDTCAVDGLCAGSCPVNINTGDLVKRLRRESHSSFSNSIALQVAKHFSIVEKSVRFFLKTGIFLNRVFGKNSLHNLTSFIRKGVGDFPLWSNLLLAPPTMEWARKVKAISPAAEDIIVYFPSCISRLMGSYEGKEKNIMEAFMSVCHKTSTDVIIPSNIRQQCCSQLFGSKGYTDAYRYKANEIIDELWKSSEMGKRPVVIDVSSCAYTLKNLLPVLSEDNKKRYHQLKIWDTVEFIYHKVIPKSSNINKQGNIVLHPVCSLEKMNTTWMLEKVARHYASTVTIPLHTGCCGMAGDRGFMIPELTASATNKEALEVKEKSYTGYYSTTKTCELALTEATAANYESILYLVDDRLGE